MTSKLWYTDMGFDENPFSIKPVKFSEELVGVESKIREIIKLIKAGKMVFISGDYGRGKTSVLKRLVKQFGGKRKVAYFSGNQIHQYLDVDNILINAGGFLSRLFRMRSDEVILLLDEVQDLNQNDIDQVLEAYEEGYLKSVIIVAATIPFEEINEKFSGMLGKNKFELNGFTAEMAVTLVRRRIGELQLLSDEIIERVHSINPNPRSILKNCEDLCRHAVESGDERVTEEHIEKVLL